MKIISSPWHSLIFVTDIFPFVAVRQPTTGVVVPTIYGTWIVHQQESSMMALCVILVSSSPFTESDGSVQNAPTMICVPYAITVTNTTLGIDFTESPLLELKGKT